MSATATERSRARNARAARIIAPITLDSERAGRLAAVLDRSGETTAAWVRRMIDEQHAVIESASL